MSEEMSEEITEPSYYLADGVPGTGEAPDYYKADKYKTVADQAKAYTNLEKMHGELANKFQSFTGAPEQYEVVAPEGIELSQDDPLVSAAFEWGKENNLNQDGFNSLVELYATIEASKEKANEEFFNEQIAQIDNFESRSQNINDFLKANEMEALADQITNKEALEQFEKLLDMAGKPSINPEGEGDSLPSEEEIQGLMFEEDQFGQRIYNKSPERRAQVKKMLERRVGKGQFQQVVG